MPGRTGSTLGAESFPRAGKSCPAMSTHPNASYLKVPYQQAAPWRKTFRVLLMIALAAPAAATGDTLYQFGNPTADEQAYIEYINRARANPAAEAARLAATTDPDILKAYAYFSVNLATMQNEIKVIPAAQPLAPNANLTNAARGHSQWMLANATQSHNETNPNNTTEDRINASGYDWWNYGESVAGATVNPWHGHAGFEVDWGPGGSGGMQAGRGHRVNNHFGDFREIGVGVVNGTNGSMGPQLVTQDFGDPYDAQPFGTGVAYYDLNGNNFYDAGEGIGGLNVSMTGVTYYCTSAGGGGWAVPIPTDGTTRTVTFAGLGINQTRSLVIPENMNAKTDLKLTYAPPSITSVASAPAGSPHNFTFTGIGGATGYKVNRWNVAPAQTELCNSLTEVTTSTSAGYPVLNTAVKQEGSGSFHLANPGFIGNQIVELKTLFHGQSSPSLTFQSRLRNTTSDERHRVQVKEDGSTVWQEVYSQTGGTAEANFSAKTVNLPTMANKEFKVRFILSFAGGSSYGSTADDFGWFIDAIAFTQMGALTNNFAETLATTSRSYTLPAGNYQLSVSPIISGVEFPNADQNFMATGGPPPPSYTTWASSAETSGSLPAGTIANNPNGDQDKDGRPNLVEYAFGCSPVNPGDAATRLPAIQSGGPDFKIRYVKDTALADVTVTPIASSDLTNWKAPGDSGAPAGFNDSLISTAGNLQTREATIPAAAGAGWFVKVRVVKP